MRVLICLCCLALVAAGVGVAGLEAGRGVRTEAAAVKEYKYKCVRTGKIHTYERPGNYKCPEHPEHNLVPVK